MSAQILDGKARAASLRAELTQEVQELKNKFQKSPHIVSIVVGQDPASLSYVASQQKTATNLGIHCALQNLDEKSTQEVVLNLIDRLNKNHDIHGIIVNKPLPKTLDFEGLIDAIDADKDIEGLNVKSLGYLMTRHFEISPCTPAAVIELLKVSGVNLKGKHAVVIGRSEIVGKPVGLLLLKEDMTVTIAHSKTQDLPSVVRGADVVVAAVGRPLFVKGDWIKKGAIVIDVGINQVDGKIIGDVDFASASLQASFISPVPGGVGPLTSVMLMKNALATFKIQIKNL